MRSSLQGVSHVYKHACHYLDAWTSHLVCVTLRIYNINLVVQASDMFISAPWAGHVSHVVHAINFMTVISMSTIIVIQPHHPIPNFEHIKLAERPHTHHASGILSCYTTCTSRFSHYYQSFMLVIHKCLIIPVSVYIKLTKRPQEHHDHGL